MRSWVRWPAACCLRWPAQTTATPDKAPAPAKPAVDVAPAAPLAFTSAPVVTNVSDDAATILIGVNGPSAITVRYGETDALGLEAHGSRHGLNSFDAKVHKVRLTGLKPGVAYHYRVEAQAVNFKNAYRIERGDVIAADAASFKTLNSRADAIRFVVWNDTHDRADTLAAFHEQTDKLRPDFMLWNGDVSNDISREEQFTSLFLSPGKGLPYAARTPLMLVRGNHDMRGAAARMIGRYTDAPEGRSYYSFRHGPVAFLVLDTGEDKPDEHPVYAGLNDFCAFRHAQAEWLAREIEKPELKSAPHKVLFCHIPLAWIKPTAAGDWCADAKAKWHDLLVKAGVTLVMSGHTHQHAHLPPVEGRPYHQLVGGGPNLKDATIIEGSADAKTLTVTMKKLADGTELAKIALTA
ncbi:MAG: FN3 domain-containing metallophosphoesterase family protein [Pirellulales bacterium]